MIEEIRLYMEVYDLYENMFLQKLTFKYECFHLLLNSIIFMWQCTAFKKTKTEYSRMSLLLVPGLEIKNFCAMADICYHA